MKRYVHRALFGLLGFIIDDTKTSYPINAEVAQLRRARSKR